MKKKKDQKNGSKRRAEEEPKVRHEQIAIRAYQLYLARGAVEGDAIRDWLQAEREIGGRNVSGDSP